MNLTFQSPPAGGTVTAIPSKSIAHRLLICAAFADQPTRILCPTTSDDIDATIRVLRALGTHITQSPDGFTVTPSPSLPTHADLDCGESGSTLRFMLPVAAALGTSCRFFRRARLPDRPLSPLYEELRQHGVQLPEDPKTEPLPLSGKLCAGEFTLAANISSQFISGLLLAMPLLGAPSSLTLTDSLESADYIRLTTDALHCFGISVAQSDDGRRYTVQPSRCISPGECRVEGDWSGSAVWLTAGAIGNTPITVRGLNPASAQGDRRALDILRAFGARLEESPDSITVFPSELHGIFIDARQIPDLVPVLAVAAAAACGKTEIDGIARLRLKESDRAAAVTEMIRSLGGNIECTDNRMTIHGGSHLHGGSVSSSRDHRMVMCAFLSSLLADSPVTVTGAECITKSYPGFVRDLAALGGTFKETEAAV